MTNSETKNFSQNVSSSYHLGGKSSNECKKDSLNIPKLRFKGYNDEWKQDKLGNLFEIKAGGDIDNKKLSKNKNEQYKYPVYANALQNNGLYGYSDIYKISGETITVTGRGDVGHAIARKENYYPIVRLLILKPIVKQDVDFWANAINNTRIFVESTGVPQLTAPQLAKIKIYYPSLQEQEKIAAFLTLIDKKIEKQKELIELLKKYKRGLLSQIFSQKLRFKDENGNNYPDWEEKRLGDICTIIGGGTPDTNNDKYWGDDINWFTPTEIIKKYVDCSNRKISNLGLLKSSAKILPIGTVLLTTRATLGEMSILQIEATTNQGFQSLIPNKNLVTSEFIYYCQPIIKYYCYKYANGSTFLEISKQSLAKLKLKIPYLNEQNKISEYLSKFDNKIQQEESRLNYLQMYKKGLLQQMFI